MITWRIGGGVETRICILCGLELAIDDRHDCNPDHDDERTIPGWSPTGTPPESALAIIPLKKLPFDCDPES